MQLEESDDAQVSELWRKTGSYLDTRGGYQQFLINCVCQDSNSRPRTLIPCHVSCASHLSQKSELMKKLVQFTYTITMDTIMRVDFDDQFPINNYIAQVKNINEPNSTRSSFFSL